MDTVEVSDRLSRTAIRRWEQGVWCLVATVLAAERSDPSVAEAAQAVLAASEVGGGTAPESETHGFVAQLKASLLQAAMLVGAERPEWFAQSDEALLAQGHASAQGAPAIVRYLVPSLGDLATRLATPGARILDVGTGVAALAVAFAEQLPSATVTAIDVSDRVLALARVTVAASAVAGRVQLRREDVAALTECDRYDLVWLPAPFLAPAVLRAGVQRAAVALRPGGWIILGHGKLHGEPLDVALTRLKTFAYGGTALSDIQARELLTDVGLDHVATTATPHDAPAITVGRRREDDQTTD